MSESFRLLARDARRTLRQGPAAITRRQRARLSETLADARARSPYYCELYRDLPEGRHHVRDGNHIPASPDPAQRVALIDGEETSS